MKVYNIVVIMSSFSRPLKY